MSPKIKFAVTLAAALASVAAAGTAFAAKITMEEAKALALKAVPGTITRQELENEHGREQYSFEIKPTGEKEATAEVAIDANDGSVVSIDHDED